MPEPRAISPGIRRRSHTVRALAADQEGIVGRAQLLERAVGGSAIDRALRSDTLHRGVYCVVPPELLGENGRYGTKQIDDRPDAVITGLVDAFADAITLGYHAADQPPSGRPNTATAPTTRPRPT